MVARILVVEDSDALRRGIVAALLEHGELVDETPDAAAAIEKIAAESEPPYDVVLTDLRLSRGDGEGFEVLRAARERDPRTSVVMMTAYATIESAVEAMRLGAFDFIQKPVDLEQLELRIRRAAEHGRLLREVGALRAERAARYADDDLVAQSPAMRAAVELAGRVASTRSTVLVSGETGTGKEIIANLVHRLSPRADGPFVKVNCAALPETLLESELFGHERGAFTGADRRRIGRFEEASGGTLFLDEIGDTAPATQVKLLRVLQDQEFHRLGATKAMRTDARIIAASNRDLGQAIREGGFREDLFFRLNVIGIHLPPLRERPEDVVALAEHFRRRFAADLAAPARRFGADALASIRGYAWPGNVRELRNAVERAVLMSDSERIEAADLGLVGWTPEPTDRGAILGLPTEGLSLQEMERQLVLAALRQVDFVQKDAAALLQISRRKLNYMIARMGITHPNWRRNRRPQAHGGEAPESAGRP